MDQTQINEADFFNLVDDYQSAKLELDRAEAKFESLKETLKSYGTVSVGDVKSEISVISRESVSWTDIKQKRPSLAAELVNAGLVKKSEYEKLNVTMGNK